MCEWSSGGNWCALCICSFLHFVKFLRRGCVCLWAGRITSRGRVRVEN